MDGELVFGTEKIRAYLSELPRDRSATVIIDDKVWSHHSLPIQKMMRSFSQTHFEIVSGGENFKTFSSVELLVQKLLEKGITKRDFLVSIGGGTISDVGTFVAANLFRGVSHLIFPTSLLGQIDAGIGGKGALNSGARKNVFGCFHFPVATCVDFQFLSTLPENEILSGLGEMLKQAILMDVSTLEQLEIFLSDSGRSNSAPPHHQHWDVSALEPLIIKQAEFKTHVVSMDPFETNGQRQFLHLGHELAHALELDLHLPHGIAVAWSLMVVGILSEQAAGLSKNVRIRVSKIAKILTRNFSIDPLVAWEAWGKHKKCNWILFQNIGHPAPPQRLSENSIREALFAAAYGELNP